MYSVGFSYRRIADLLAEKGVCFHTKSSVERLLKNCGAYRVRRVRTGPPDDEGFAGMPLFQYPLSSRYLVASRRRVGAYLFWTFLAFCAIRQHCCLFLLSYITLNPEMGGNTSRWLGQHRVRRARLTRNLVSHERVLALL